HVHAGSWLAPRTRATPLLVPRYVTGALRRLLPPARVAFSWGEGTPAARRAANLGRLLAPPGLRPMTPWRAWFPGGKDRRASHGASNLGRGPPARAPCPPGGVFPGGKAQRAAGGAGGRLRIDQYRRKRRCPLASS